MAEPTRPSRQFIIRGSIAIGIVAIVLLVQTDWFRALLHKKPLPPAVTPQTVGDIIGKDSNKNGIADWEEKLWGLDPTVLYTNGVPNKQIIEEKKRSLGVSGDTGVPENETDALARELLTITAALGQSGEVTNDTLSTVATKLADSVEFKQVSNHYSLKDLQTVPTTKASLQAYYKSVGTITAKYTNNAEIDLFIKSIENNDYSQLSVLLDTQKKYQQFAKELTTIPTPVGIEGLHLSMINNVYGLSVSLGYLAELPNNSANAFAGVALYKIYDAQLTDVTISIEDYLTQYGIL